MNKSHDSEEEELESAITKLQAIQQQMQGSYRKQQQFTAMVENSFDFIALADFKGSLIYINEEGKKMVGLGESIRNHPQGLDMMLHDSQSLSGGQRQSVGLARLVLQDPKVVLLDEPTSALDQQTEQRVIAQLMPWLKGRTLILATHKKPLLAWTERAVVLRMGRRILDGSLTDVLAQAAQPAKDQESA